MTELETCEGRIGLCQKLSWLPQKLPPLLECRVSKKKLLGI
jgi:hypothetical protein